MAKKSELVVGQAYYWNIGLCILWYNGRGYNAKDYEFVNQNGEIVLMNEAQIEGLRKEV